MSFQNLYKKLKQEYLDLGGDANFLAKLPPYYNVIAESKLRHAIKNLKSKIEPIAPEPKPIEKPKPSKSGFGHIGQYSLELHDTYRRGQDLWLKLCSMKVRFNMFLPHQEKECLAHQMKMIKVYRELKQVNKNLEYYKQNKRVLPQDSDEDLEQLTPGQLYQRRRTLRSGLTSKKKTIAKLKKNLPQEDDPKYLARLSTYQDKVEAAELMILKIEKITKLLNE